MTNTTHHGDSRTPAVWEVERDRHGLMFSVPLEVGECRRVVPVENYDRLAQEVRDLHADAVREHVGESVLADRDRLREVLRNVLDFTADLRLTDKQVVMGVQKAAEAALNV